MDNYDINMSELILLGQQAEFSAHAKQFTELMMHYECAIREVETKLRVLSSEFNITYNRNPIESIKTRLKQPRSILEKLNRKGLPLTLQSIEDNLNDVAGIRVICSFQDDIYKLAEILALQDDVSVIEVKDYIENPKPNGYRSLHLIVETPIFLSSYKKQMKAEIQFRTIAMDFWASLEHTLKYKQQIANSDEISARLFSCAEIINKIDIQMLDIRNLIDASEVKSDE